MSSGASGVIEPGQNENTSTKEVTYKLEPTGSRITSKLLANPAGSGTYRTEVAFFDGLGRPLQQQAEGLVNGQRATVVTEAVLYEQEGGRVVARYSPFVAPTPVSQLAVIPAPQASSRFTYDALGRLRQTNTPDQQTLTTSYPKTFVTRTCDAKPMVLMAMADARLRGGNRRAAERLFHEVVSREPGEPWVGWASVGVGWIAMADGERDEARERFAVVAGSESPSRALASVVLGLLDAEAGRTEEAREVLARVADDPAATPHLRQAASLGVGYALYWAGQYDDAAERFDLAATTWSSGPLWDATRYAAAIARWRSGQKAEAQAALRQLASGSVGRTEEPVSLALLPGLSGHVPSAGYGRMQPSRSSSSGCIFSIRTRPMATVMVSPRRSPST